MYEGKRIYLSIGALDVAGIKDRLDKGFTVVAYEPEEKAYVKYQSVKHQNLFIFNKAVSDFDGQTVLYDCTILSQESFGRRSDVEVVSLDSVLDPIKEVHVLHLNCEGSEIPILMNTKMKNLVKCKRIRVEFHKFVPRFCITDETVQACVQRLGQRFKAKDQHTYHPDYVFLEK